jgi:hypothetical protein
LSSATTTLPGNAYDQRYWPARQLIDADGFIRYQHFGEDAY